MSNLVASPLPMKDDSKTGGKDVWVEDSDGEITGVMAVYHSYEPEHRRDVENRLRRKIDTRILPLIVVIYLFNYLDRNSITQARLYGLEKDTGVKGAEYQTAISIFSAGYILMQIPSTILMTKLRPSIFLPTCIIVWAIVSGCTGAVHNTAGLLVVRLFLGFVEAPFFPGAIYYLSCWYTKREIGVRMALLICGILLSNSFAGLISAGILSGMQGVGRIASWRWLFILEALATMVIGVVALFVLPDYPATTAWLTEEEKVVAQGRLAADAGSDVVLDEEKVPIMRGFIWAAKDIRVWIFACLQMATTASISYSHFFPTLIQQLGFKDSTKVLLLTSPPYLVAFFWALSWAWVADRHQSRSVPSGVSQCLAIVGTVLLIAVDGPLWARYGFTFLAACGTFGVYSTTYAWLSSTITQPPVKRAVAIGIANSCANIASLFANHFWLDQYAPRYRESWACLLGFQSLGLACILSLRFLLQRANKKFDSLSNDDNVNDAVFIARLDEEERKAVQNGFRYVV
ncbi:Allantoate permease [Penicillium ucsense]|uniref:Allantoate permease n=1 Tax=Penicillium ucsense TaxID=2839758 RepID=A0A8J8W666_9EURO|nr:Allantoate permease [Penicillium ucsense]KAF7734018.1 Allantoate permease [Penicillium ucsense]